MSDRIDQNHKKYGYARVSSKSQEANSLLEFQKQKLVRNGILESNIIIEVGSATNEIKNRPGFQNLIENVSEARGKNERRDQDAQRSINNLVEQLSLGNRNPGIGTENVFKDVYELRGKNRARVYYREVGGKIEVLAKSVKSNQQKVINILKKMYG